MLGLNIHHSDGTLSTKATKLQATALDLLLWNETKPLRRCEMLLFDFVVEHWFLSLVVYVLVTATTVFRFRRQIVMKSRWYRKVHYHLTDRWEARQLQWIGTIVLLVLVLLPITLLLFPVAPILWIVLGHLDAKEQKRRDEADKAYREKERAERERVQQENVRRCEARKQWLVENKPKLYYNTVSGVTAVLRPADYADTQKQTERSRRNGFWEKDNVLLPVRDTFVFVTKQGREMIDANTGSDFVGRYKVAGWISQLDDIVEKSGAELVRAEDIFVPWVNETLVPYKQQGEGYPKI
jgi:hypothetical protein